MNLLDLIISLAVLLYSVVIHEVMHAVVAEKMGDSTAREEGRITLNPIPHIDPMGSIILPLILHLSGLPVFGAAKPVPVNYNRMSNPRLGMLLVSLAGPASNLALAVLCVIPFKLGLINTLSAQVLSTAIGINLSLAVLNILPIPPLDGSKVWLSFAPLSWIQAVFRYEMFGFLIVYVFAYTGLLGAILYPLFNGFLKLFGLN